MPRCSLSYAKIGIICEINMIQAIIIQNSTIQACLSSQVSGYGIQSPIGTHNTSNDSLCLAQSNPHLCSVKLCVVYKNLFSLKIVFQIYYGIYLWKILFKRIYKNTFNLLIVYHRTYHIQCSIMHRYYKFYITGIYSFNTQ